jgi:hypothetical protein
VALRKPRSQKRDLGHPHFAYPNLGPPEGCGAVETQVSEARPGAPSLCLSKRSATRRCGNPGLRSETWGTLTLLIQTWVRWRVVALWKPRSQKRDLGHPYFAYPNLGPLEGCDAVEAQVSEARPGAPSEVRYSDLGDALISLDFVLFVRSESGPAWPCRRVSAIDCLNIASRWPVMRLSINLRWIESTSDRKSCTSLEFFMGGPLPQRYGETPKKICAILLTPIRLS